LAFVQRLLLVGHHSEVLRKLLSVSVVFLYSSIALCQAKPGELADCQKQPLGVPCKASQLPIPDAPSSSTIDPNEKTLHQSPRIMGVLPNFTAVDSNTRLPPLLTRDKFNLALHDSVDYSSFLLVAGLAAKGLYSNSIPSLGKGPAGFGRYYWRQFADQLSGTFFTEAIFPTITHEDPRYYTLGKRGFVRRTSYALSRTFVTKNDYGKNEFNISEVGGNASEAALSNLYYPSAERGFGQSAKNFATQTVITAGANVLKEFWPDIRKNLFRMSDEPSKH
jgi:hypothetical protein